MKLQIKLAQTMIWAAEKLLVYAVADFLKTNPFAMAHTMEISTMKPMHLHYPLKSKR